MSIIIIHIWRPKKRMLFIKANTGRRGRCRSMILSYFEGSYHDRFKAHDEIAEVDSV